MYDKIILMNVTSIHHTCCFTWKESFIRKKRKIREVKSGDVYYSGASNKILRYNFAKLVLGTLPIVGIVRPIARSILLLSGSWYRVGSERADREWIRMCRIWYAQNCDSPSPSGHSYQSLRSEFSRQELVDQICKLVTLPFFCLAQLFAAIWGLISPLEGRKFYGDLESASRIQLPKDYRWGWIEVTNYLALCMQPIQSWERGNLYSYSYPFSWKDHYIDLKHMKEEGGLDEVVAQKLQFWNEAFRVIKTYLIELSSEEKRAYLAELNTAKGRLENDFPSPGYDPLKDFEQEWQSAVERAAPWYLRELLNCGNEINRVMTSFQSLEKVEHLRQKQASLMQILEAMLDPAIKPL